MATYYDMATDWTCWTEYADTQGAYTESQFDAMTVDQKIAILTDVFGIEDPADEAQA